VGSSWSDRVDEQAVIDIASDLIAIPSPSGEELNVMEFVAGWSSARGLDAQIVAKDPKRPNVVVSVGDPAAGPTIVMNGHLDTVPVSDAAAWKTDPFDPVVSADRLRLYGRGASDMKSATGVMLYLMGLFKDASLKGRLQAHIVSDEELSGRYGTIHLLDEVKAGRLPKPDYCLIGEKSDLQVRNAERGILWFDITFHGRASHTAAARATGINAIALAAKGVLALEKDIDKFHPAIGKPVISVNIINAGVAHNVVPGECTISVDRRLIPGESRESVLAEARAALDEVAASDPNFRYELTEPEEHFCDANITEADSPIVQAVQQAIREVTGKEPQNFVAWAGVTDGRFYRQMGIDTVGYGPGGENAHGANEAVYIPELLTMARVWANTIENVLKVG
jgi:acetylornithine deacetylase/succinyl-diaminopimelate desuccinylase family protein